MRAFQQALLNDKTFTLLLSDLAPLCSPSSPVLLWKTNNGSVVSQGQALSNALRHELATKTGEIPNADTVINATFDHLVDGFDSQYGGFGVTTKFPKPVDLNFLLFASKYLKSNSPDKSAKAINIVRKTLSAMVRGGIHDHLGGGFHRYAVDRQWRVPHFEKMLYDQGQLLTVFADFYKITGEFADAIPDIVGYLDSNLTHKTGGFYAAEDAESYPFEGANKKEEGAYFVFMTEELMSWLTPEQYRAFEAYFNISADGNTPSSADPRGELRCKNVLFTLDKPIAELAQRVGQDVAEFEENLKAAKAIVLEKRGHRPAPGLDTKFITSWNSLAISGLCSAYAAFPKEKAYLERAQKAVEFIKENLIDSDGKLLRTVYTDGKNGKIVQIPEPVFAFSDDYTFLIQALLDLYQADFNEDHLKLALKLQNQLDTDFFDPEHKAGYFTNRAGDNTLFARFSEDQDGAEPAPNSVAVDNLLRFADLLGDETFREQANWILKGHAHRLSKHPHAITKMVAAAGRAATSSMQIVIVAPTRDDSVAGQMLDLVHKKFLPDASLAFVSEDVDVKDSLILTKNEHTRELAKATPGATTAYVCQNFACGLPATDVFELEARLLD
uniref:Thioredoxin domain-containing protein n=1 Tax=Panagrellus redivivus TaxID=6233 RepID=A0A7E4VEC0_PANRE